MRTLSKNEIEINSWMELMEVFTNDATQAVTLGRYRSDNVYRGMADSKWPLLTSLQRCNTEYWKIEKHLLRNFIKYAPQTSVAFDTFWNWLTLAQHHGLPTRLLDWTYSPMIALHFALDNHTSFNAFGDAVIWSVDLDKLKTTLPARELSIFQKDGAYSFSIENLSELWKSLDELSLDVLDDFLIFFEPPSFDDRIVNQYALLSTTTSNKTVVSEWLQKHEDHYTQKSQMGV